MMKSYSKKIIITGLFVCLILLVKTFAQQQQQRKEQDEPPKNLKVLPKSTSAEDVHKIMRTISKSLGTRCDHCHVGTPQEGKPYPKFDFASDDKPEKDIARKMMVMVDSINTNYIGKMGVDDFERVTCVTCHMGNLKPTVSVDSLPKRQ